MRPHGIYFSDGRPSPGFTTWRAAIRGWADALLEAQLPKRSLYIAHEVNAETERLIRQRQIDYMLTQDLDRMVVQIGEVLLEVKAAGGITNLTKILPIRVFTPFHFL